MVCVPNGPPKCDICPVREYCLGRKRGTTEVLPVKKPKKARKVEEMTVYLLLRDDKVALRKRSENGLLAGLWEFPNVVGCADEATAPDVVNAWGLQPKQWKNKLTAKHIFTHVEWHMTGYTLEVSGDGPADWVWVDGERLETHAVPSAFARYYAEAKRWLETT